MAPRVFATETKVFVRFGDEIHPMWTTITHYPGSDVDDKIGWSLRPPADAVEMALSGLVPPKAGEFVLGRRSFADAVRKALGLPQDASDDEVVAVAAVAGLAMRPNGVQR